MEVYMKRKTTLISSSLAVALALAGSPLAQAQGPQFGTWKMNTTKSKYDPDPVPKRNIGKWEADDAAGSAVFALIEARLSFLESTPARSGLGRVTFRYSHLTSGGRCVR
jgi:hypothetical protein